MQFDLDAYRTLADEGDVLVYEGSAWISRRIQKATGVPWSHVAMSIGHEFIVEATWPRVRVVPVTETLDNVRRFVLLRKNEQSLLQAARRAKWALTRSGWRYDGISLSWWLLPDILRGRKNWISSDRPICSELVAWAFWKNGEHLFPGVDVENIVPGHFPACPELSQVGEFDVGGVSATWRLATRLRS